MHGMNGISVVSLILSWMAAIIAGSNLNVTSQLSFGNGVNLQPSYYNNGDVHFGWSLMKSYDKITTVRIEVEPDKVSQAKTWISEAKSNGYKIIVTYHKCSVLGSDDTNELNEAASWWVTNYKTLSASGSFTINLMNEWGSHSMSSDKYASAYQSAISKIRSVYSGYIIIDCAGWGQESATAAAAVKSGTLYDKNIILSMHVYPNGWNQGEGHSVQTADIDDLQSAGRPCMIGEFGTEPSGPVDVSGVVSYARDKGWPVLGWAWNGDGGSVMNMVTPSWAVNAQATSFKESSYFKVVYDLL